MHDNDRKFATKTLGLDSVSFDKIAEGLGFDPSQPLSDKEKGTMFQAVKSGTGVGKPHFGGGSERHEEREENHRFYKNNS